MNHFSIVTVFLIGGLLTYSLTINHDKLTELQLINSLNNIYSPPLISLCWPVDGRCGLGVGWRCGAWARHRCRATCKCATVTGANPAAHIRATDPWQLGGGHVAGPRWQEAHCSPPLGTAYPRRDGIWWRSRQSALGLSCFAKKDGTHKVAVACLAVSDRARWYIIRPSCAVALSSHSLHICVITHIHNIIFFICILYPPNILVPVLLVWIITGLDSYLAAVCHVLLTWLWQWC